MGEDWIQAIEILCPDCVCTGEVCDSTDYCKTKYGNDFICVEYIQGPTGPPSCGMASECVRDSGEEFCADLRHCELK